MHLLRLRIVRQGPFDEIALGFEEAAGEARMVTVIHGAGGVGKTTLLSAIANTRPGNIVLSSGFGREQEEPGAAVCDYQLGQDDPDRPHPLVVASPNTRVHLEDERESLRRKEQALFDRVAREGGFVLLAFPATRWFSRQPVAIVGAGRGLGRYDVRAPLNLEDPTRGDLARETKQCLAYAAITRALTAERRSSLRFERLASAMQQAVDSLVQIVGFRWTGLDPGTLEPVFSDEFKRTLIFDALPMRARQLAAFGALTVRALWAAYPARDPLQAEGIVAIDEVDLHQDPSTLARLVPALRAALPMVQWILTTTSPEIAASCDISSVIALRRHPEHQAVELCTGELARTH